MPKRALSLERRTHISNLAEGVADYFFPDTWIDPEKLIREHGLTLSFNRYGDSFDGMLQCKSGAFHGRVPSHPSFCDHHDAESIVEQEANLLAARLLAPSTRICKVVNFTQPSLAQINKLQETFKISLQSAAIRVVEDSTVPCGAVMWRQDGKPWGFANRPMEELGLQFPKKLLTDLPADSATSLCWNEVPSESGLNNPRESVAIASHWFHGVFPGSGRDKYLKETCVRLGSYGCFSILTLHPSL